VGARQLGLTSVSLAKELGVDPSGVTGQYSTWVEVFRRRGYRGNTVGKSINQERPPSPLFSLDKLDAFPVDTWIRKGMTEQYLNGKKTSDNEIRAFANDYFGRFRGYANQYLFFHWRMLNK
jgi:hypothetical protein